MLAAPAGGDKQENPEQPTPWVLLVETDSKKLPAAALAWEEAGYGVEIASSVQNALECLAVTTPFLIVVDGELYWPPTLEARRAHIRRPGARRAHFRRPGARRAHFRT